MPFKETCVLDETLGFISAYLEGEETMTALCEAFGISRQWGYELVRRYEAEGLRGLAGRSRAPHHCGQATAPEIADAIKALRRKHPSWGPKKLRVVLARRAPQIVWPAPSTMGDLLRREGLVPSRRRRRRPLPVSQPFGAVMAPNDLWCIDFKGWFRTGDGRRCDPLTLSDADSRYLIACRAVRPITADVDTVTDAAFREYGLPYALRSDNGPPFASSGPGGLTRLAVKWLKLGIRLERMDPGSPQQNARHERMHATLKAETAAPPARSLAAQQQRFNDFRAIYNDERPHEGIGQETPASRYQPSPRPYPRRLEGPHYDATQTVRRVRSNGQIKWGGDFLFLSEALIGEHVAVDETETGDWVVSFANLPLALINRHTKKLRRFGPARPGRPKARHQKTGKSVNDVPGLKCQ